MIQHEMKPDELEYLLDISGRTPYWICRQLFCDAVFSNYLETAKDVGATMPSLMFIAEHWQDVAKPFVETQLPGYNTYVMGGHLMFYEYPEKWNNVLEDFLNKIWFLTVCGSSTGGFFVRFLLFIQKFQYTNKRTALLRMTSVVARGLASFNIYDWRMHSQ